MCQRAPATKGLVLFCESFVPGLCVCICARVHLHVKEQYKIDVLLCIIAKKLKTLHLMYITDS